MVEPTANFHTINMEAPQTERSSHHPGKNTFNRRKCAREAQPSSDGANNLESQMVNQGRPEVHPPKRFLTDVAEARVCSPASAFIYSLLAVVLLVFSPFSWKNLRWENK